MLLNTSECHEVPRKTKLRDAGNIQKDRKDDPFSKTYHRHGHTTLTRMVASGCGLLRTVANGCGQLWTSADACGRKRSVDSTHRQPSDSQSETGTITYYTFRKTRNTTSKVLRLPQKLDSSFENGANVSRLRHKLTLDSTR